ncbi:MAG: GNAT family N-acetyltransferase, partial [Chromatiales bacterium]|nr:GNAT family N-acetyltransferase [Chromatiales bacterium]
RTFPDTTRLIIIEIGGRPAAAGFIVRSGSRLEIPWASSLRDFNHLSVNMMLYWEVLSFAIHSGCDTFDFGRSSKGSGPYRFKRQWGALERQLHWHYWVRDGADMPGLTPDNPRYRAAIQVWQKLPVFLTRIIGPPLVKNLP